MASMVGLAVAVDYSLFVLVRTRQAVRGGLSAEQAAAVAASTAGRAVRFSGAGVILALGALMLVPAPAIRSMALCSMVVVALAVLAATTLLPALLALLGLDRRAQTDGGGRGERGVAWVSGWALGRPARALIGGLVVLGVLAAPLAALRTGDGALRELRRDDPARQAFEAASSVVGPGSGAPVKVLVDSARAEGVVEQLASDSEVAATSVPAELRGGRQSLVLAVPRESGEAPGVKELVRRLRAGLPAGSLVGGASALQLDFDRAALGAVKWMAVAALLLAWALFTWLLRAPVLALVGVLTTALSVLAALGVLVVVFDDPWSAGSGYLNVVAIPVILAVVFGISSDYQVLMLSQVRERRPQAPCTLVAVQEAMKRSAWTVSVAAAVMVAAFGVFVISGTPLIKQIGLGVAIAVAIDATVVRLLVLPAAIAVLGERAWWRPGRGPHVGHWAAPPS